jgi:hypothetical protein
MLHLEPGARATLDELLGPLSALFGPTCTCAPVLRAGARCLCRTPDEHADAVAEEAGSEDDADVEDAHADADAWLRGIVPCSVEGAAPLHVHIKVAVDEKAHKRRFF